MEPIHLKLLNFKEHEGEMLSELEWLESYAEAKAELDRLEKAAAALRSFLDKKPALFIDGVSFWLTEEYPNPNKEKPPGPEFACTARFHVDNRCRESDTFIPTNMEAWKQAIEYVRKGWAILIDEKNSRSIRIRI